MPIYSQSGTEFLTRIRTNTKSGGDVAEIINSMEFPGYFLIFAIYQLREEQEYPRVTVRGSAAGSLVAYALGITTIDPIRYGPLLRTVSESQPEEHARHQRISAWRGGTNHTLSHGKNGSDQVSHIITFGRAGEASSRDVGRALNMPTPRWTR
jgi:DNA polymerase-3 subunit alpha